MLEIKLDLVGDNFFYDLHQRNDSMQMVLDIFLVGTCVPARSATRDEHKVVVACPCYNRVDLSGITYFNSEEQLQAGDILQDTNECCIELAAAISNSF